MHPNVAAYFAPNNRIQTTYCQASYLLSGKLPTIRQATYYQASYLLSDKPSAVMKLATYCQASYLLSGKNSAVSEMHPKGIDMHPDVSIYFAPNNRRHVNINLLISIIY